VPPRAAYNDRQWFLAKVEIAEAEGELRWKHDHSSQKGNVYRSLCRECNTRLGSYNRAYVEFTQRIAEEGELRARSIITVIADYPLRILKTAVQCFLSSLASAFRDEHPWMRRFLWARDNREIPGDVSVWAYAMCYRVGRSSGPIIAGDFANYVPNDLGDAFSHSVPFAEFAFWPLGLVLAYRPIDQLLGPLHLFPLHSWRTYGYRERAHVTIDLPVLPTATPIPVEFSTIEEAERAAGGSLPWMPQGRLRPHGS